VQKIHWEKLLWKIKRGIEKSSGQDTVEHFRKAKGKGK
jgi:hypothetical protein